MYLTTCEDIQLYTGEAIPAGSRLKLTQPYSKWNTFQAITWNRKEYFVHSSSFEEVMSGKGLMKATI